MTDRAHDASPGGKPATVEQGGVAGVAVAGSVTAVVASAACCVLPLAVPALAASAAGGALAWLGGAHAWITWLAAVIVVGAWVWVWRQSATRKARPARSTLWLMGASTAAMVLAFAWPAMEPALMAAVTP